jgi:hypothetical protein
VKPPPGRQPTAEEIESIKALLEQAGGEKALHRWIKQATAPRRRGRPAKSSRYADDDEQALHIAQTLHLASELPGAIKKISLHKAIKTVTSRGSLGWRKERGPSPQAMVGRLLARAAAANKEPYAAPNEADRRRIRQWSAQLDEMAVTLKVPPDHPALRALKQIAALACEAPYSD